MKKRTLNRRIAKATGLVGVGMLALTGCEGTAEEQQDVQEDGQEGADPDGAEGEHPEPDEIADDEDEEDDDEEDGVGAAEAPDLADLEDEIWEAALDQESVHLHVTQEEMPEELVEEFEDDDAAAPLRSGADADERDPDDHGLDDGGPDDAGADEDGTDEDGSDGDRNDEPSAGDPEVELTYTGDLAGEGSSAEYSYGEFGGVERQGTFLSFGDAQYQSRDGFISDLLLSAPEDAEIPEEEIAEAFDRDWIDHSDFEIMMNYTAEQHIEEIRDNLSLVIQEDSLADLDAEGSEGTHEGEDVWIYETDDIELIVLADEDEPLMLSLDIGIEGIESSVLFSEWNESESPEEPEEDEVYTAEEALDLVEQL